MTAPTIARLLELPAREGRRARWMSAAIAASSGLLWVLAAADFDLWPLAYVAAVPVLWLVDRAPTARRAAFLAWLSGAAANVAGFYWIVGLLVRFGHMPLPVGVLALLLLAAYQAVVFLLFGLAVRAIRGRGRGDLCSGAALRSCGAGPARAWGRPLPMVVVVPVAMVAFEILVPFIFPWYLAVTQAWVTPVIQIAELTGPVGVTALIMAVNGALFDLAFEPTRRRKLASAAAAAAVAGAAVAFGLVRMHQIDARRAAAPALRVGLVQGNQLLEGTPPGVDPAAHAAAELEGLQRQSAELEARGARLIVWPESSYPFGLPRGLSRDFPPEHWAHVKRGFTAPVVLGAVTSAPADPYPHNTAILLDAGGAVAGRYDKMFLLMFGEYIPGVETFPWIRDLLPASASHFARGRQVTTFPLEHAGERYRLGPLICYEDIVPAFGRALAARHPHLLVNITNDAWFGDTAEPWQHLALSVFRAVEIRADLVRAVNTGVSAFVDAAGRVTARTYVVDPHIPPVGSVPPTGLLGDVALIEGGHTFYARHGDVFGYVCVAVALGLWLGWPAWTWWRRRAGASRASA